MTSLLPYTFVFSPAVGGLTYLQLVNRLMRECGASSSANPLSTVADQTGEPLRFVEWIDQAWLEIQTKHDDWPWMRSSSLLGGGVSFATVAGTGSYPLGTGTGTVGIEATGFGKWEERSFRNYPTGSPTSEIFMTRIGFDRWRDGYMYGAQRSARSRPTVVAVGPDQSVCVGPMPTSGYTIIGDYYWQPVPMSADADYPYGLPAQFNMAIVYLAMIYYGEYEAAPEVVTRGREGYAKLMRQLEALRARRVGVAGALA